MKGLVYYDEEGDFLEISVENQRRSAGRYSLEK